MERDSQAVMRSAGVKPVQPGFVQRHVGQIREGGLRILLRKFFSALGLLIWIWPVLAIRALRPIINIRFAALGSSHIGHFAGNTEVYLCERDAGIHGQRTLDVWHHYYGHSGSSQLNKEACNLQLKAMWDRTLHVSSLAKYMNHYNHLIPGGEKHYIPWRGHAGETDIHGLLGRAEPHLSFTEQEEILGQTALKEMGVPDGATFVCFHARDSAYMDVAFPGTRWDHQAYRNCDVNNYLPAAEELTRRSYFVLRMGAVVKDPLETENPMIIDYAAKHRSDFLDIYLLAKCRFFLSSHGGIDEIATIFRTPVLYSNVAHMEDEYLLYLVPGSVLIPKKLWLRNEDRYMTLRERVDLSLGVDVRYTELGQMGIEFIENTLEEISAVTEEMDQRLDGTWKSTDEDEELQRRFWSFFKTMEPGEIFPSHIGAEFLRQNQYLLS